MKPPPLCTALQQVPSLSEDLNELAARKLSPKEISLLSPRSSLKRRAEFIAGRIAARTSVARLLGHLPTSSTFQILREGDGPTGCPLVTLAGGGAAPHVSISHADGLAVAAACFSGVGLDLASIQTHEQSFVEDTFSPQELTQWAKWLGSDRTSALTLTSAFAAKEAALKWLGTGFALPLRAIEIVPIGFGLTEHPASFPVETLVFPVALIEQGFERPQILSGRFACLRDRISIAVVG